MAKHLRFPGSTKCKRPKMSDHRGRTWDQCTVIDAQGAELTGYLDTSWGEYFYFQDPDNVNQWRCAKNMVFMQSHGHANVADFRKPQPL